MLEWLIKRRIDAFEREYGYDTSYLRDMLAAARHGMPRALQARSPRTAAHAPGSSSPWPSARRLCAHVGVESQHRLQHLRRIEEKTGSKRMAELIHKLNDLQVPARID